MSPDLNVWIWERALERLLIVSFGGLSLYLGWYLFKLGIIKRQSAEFSGKTWKIKLLNVGPGIFFALFGTILIIIAAKQSLSIGLNEQNLSLKDSNIIASYGLPGTKIDKALLNQDDCKAISTIQIFAKRVIKNDQEKEAMERAENRMEILKETYAFSQYPNMKEKYNEWLQKLAIDPLFVDKLNKKDQEVFFKLQEILEGTFLEKE